MPVYPPVVINGKTYYETEEPSVFIESHKGTGKKREIIFVRFKTKERWLERGDCYSCGVADWDGFDVRGEPILVPPIERVPGKRVGERYSVVDRSYNTRKEHVCSPTYEKAARKAAKDLGLPFVCGLRHKRLTWIE